MAQQQQPVVLVTGASGYIAGHIIKQLLEKGYTVKGTVRSLKNANTKYKYLYDLPNGNMNLKLFEADLTKDDNWNDIINGCTYIFNVASPMPSRNAKYQITDEYMISTAINGLKRVLTAALKHKESIKRFILTSSIAAIQYQKSNYIENKAIHILSSDKWSDIDDDFKISAYGKAKTLSEQYFWKFLEDNDNPFEGVAINPGMVIGPVLSDRIVPSSAGFVHALLNGDFPFLPNYAGVWVDVRDVAESHVNVMILDAEIVNGKRYIVANHVLWLKDVAMILYDKYGKDGYNIPLSVQYDFVWRLIGNFDSGINQAVVPSLSVMRFAKSEESEPNSGAETLFWNEPNSGG